MKAKKVIILLIVTLIGLLCFGECQLAKGQAKWLGNVMGKNLPSDFFYLLESDHASMAGKMDMGPTQSKYMELDNG